MSRENEKIIHLSGIDTLQKALQTTYTLTAKQGCRILHVHTEYWSRHFPEWIDHIQVKSNFKRADSRGFLHESGPNYTRQLHIDSAKNWYNREQFINFIAKNSKIEVRTKRIPLAFFVDDYESFSRDMLIIESEKRKIKSAKALSEWKHAYDETMKLHLRHFSFILDEEVGPASRKKLPWIELDLSDEDKKNLLTEDRITYSSTPSTDRDYGESQEEYYRKYHMEGRWRYILKLPDDHSLVRYFEDPDPLPLPGYVTRPYFVTIPWHVWQKIKKMKKSALGKRNTIFHNQ